MIVKDYKVIFNKAKVVKETKDSSSLFSEGMDMQEVLGLACKDFVSIVEGVCSISTLLLHPSVTGFMWYEERNRETECKTLNYPFLCAPKGDICFICLRIKSWNTHFEKQELKPTLHLIAEAVFM